MNKELLKLFFNLQNAIGETEKILDNPKLYEGTGFPYFSEIRTAFSDLYKLFDDFDYQYIDLLNSIVNNGFTTFDFNLLTPEELNELTDSKGNTYILKSQEINYPHAIITFKDIDEAIDYILSK